MHALLRFVDDISQAQGKSIDISAWRVRYHHFVLQCIPAVFTHTTPCVLGRINAFNCNARSCQVTVSGMLVTSSYA